MPDKFDPYRESLIVESATIWPEEHQDLDEREKLRIEAALHNDPESCAMLEYVRMHTGFRRQITVTDEDLERLG